jgi:hypothetical protein
MLTRSLFFFFISFSCFSFSQDSTELIQDSIKVHSVKKAVIYSAIIPGAGQIYNHIAMPKGQKKAYWKVPLIYAGLGTSCYFLVSNQQTLKELKNEYLNRQNGLSISDKYIGYDDQGILTLHDQYQTWRDLSILAVGAVYLIQVVDAGVEAHFVNFDISENLSLRVSPSIINYQTAGLKLKLNFR